MRQGSWVTVDGREGTFVVLYCDESRGIADLLLMNHVRELVNGVDLTKIRLLDEIP